MEDPSLTLTLFHDGQFYVGIFERREGKQLSACRVVFGAEPKDGEIMDFLNKDFRRLSFSPKVKEERKPLPVNPKRLQREIARQVNSIGTGTKSQQALQLQREQNKAVRQEKSRRQREEEKRAASGKEKGKAPRPLTPAGFLFAFSVGSSLFTFPVCGKTRKGAFAAVVQYPYDPTEVITNGKDER